MTPTTPTTPTTPMQHEVLPCDHNKQIAACKICGPKARALWKARLAVAESPDEVPAIQPWDLHEPHYRAALADLQRRAQD